MTRKKISAAVTQADVAREAGVSVVTVSRALSEPTLVAEDTRIRILEAASRLGYTPNLLARWLSSRRSKTIGVIIHELDYAYFSPIVGALEERAKKEGYLVVMSESLRQVSIEREVVERFKQLLVSAVVVHPSSSNTEHLVNTDRAGTPVIAFARPWDEGDSIGVDNFEAGCIAARFLLERNHREVAIVGTDSEENVPAKMRVDGFLKTISDAGGAISVQRIISVAGTSFEDGCMAAEELAGKRPHAIFCVSDRLAFGLVNRLLEIGVRVPEDVAVIGCDNLPQSTYSQVPLTTVELPVSEMATLVTNTVFDRIQNPTRLPKRQELLIPKLVIRSSCP